MPTARSRLARGFRSLVASLVGASAAAVAGCATPLFKGSKAASTGAAASGNPAGSVPPEASLREDRSALDALRGDVTPEAKRENDELAFLLNVMKDGTEEPSKVRDRFGKILRDRRDRMDKRMRKEREAFAKAEKKARDEFLKQLAKDRDRHMGRKRSPEKTREFFDEQEARRREYFDSERDRRAAFESAATQSRKDFEDYVREKTNWFNQEMRGYSTAWYDRQKALGQKKEAEDKRRRLERDRRSGDGDPAGSGASSSGPGGAPSRPAEPLRAGETGG